MDADQRGVLHRSENALRRHGRWKYPRGPSLALRMTELEIVASYPVAGCQNQLAESEILITEGIKVA